MYEMYPPKGLRSLGRHRKPYRRSKDGPVQTGGRHRSGLERAVWQIRHDLRAIRDLWGKP